MEISGAAAKKNKRPKERPECQLRVLFLGDSEPNFFWTHFPAEEWLIVLKFPHGDSGLPRDMGQFKMNVQVPNTMQHEGAQTKLRHMVVLSLGVVVDYVKCWCTMTMLVHIDTYGTACMWTKNHS